VSSSYCIIIIIILFHVIALTNDCIMSVHSYNVGRYDNDDNDDDAVFVEEADDEGDDDIDDDSYDSDDDSVDSATDDNNMDEDDREEYDDGEQPMFIPLPVDTDDKSFLPSMIDSDDDDDETVVGDDERLCPADAIAEVSSIALQATAMYSCSNRHYPPIKTINNQS
jgi:hypothetical protein